jgi:hypothetical protein
MTVLFTQKFYENELHFPLTLIMHRMSQIFLWTLMKSSEKVLVPLKFDFTV